MTDVTGFGLLGHLHELALASGVAARVEADAVPAIEGALELLGAGRARRRQPPQPRVARAARALRRRPWPEPERALLCDAMTSGGLLSRLRPTRAPAMEEALAEAAPGSARIGSLQTGPAGPDRGRVTLADPSAECQSRRRLGALRAAAARRGSRPRRRRGRPTRRRSPRASGIGRARAAIATTPNRSVSVSSPARRSRRSSTAHAHSSPSAEALPPIASGKFDGLARQVHARRAAAEEDQQHAPARRSGARGSCRRSRRATATANR